MYQMYQQNHQFQKHQMNPPNPYYQQNRLFQKNHSHQMYHYYH
jgi:hypothetical protein